MDYIPYENIIDCDCGGNPIILLDMSHPIDFGDNQQNINFNIYEEATLDTSDYYLHVIKSQTFHLDYLPKV